MRFHADRTRMRVQSAEFKLSARLEWFEGNHLLDERRCGFSRSPPLTLLAVRQMPALVWHGRLTLALSLKEGMLAHTLLLIITFRCMG